MEDRRLLIIVDREDDEDVINERKMMDREGNEKGDIKVWREKIESMEKMKVVWRVERIERRKDWKKRGKKIIGKRKDKLMEILRRKKRKEKGDDDIGRGKLREVEERKRVLEKDRKRRIGWWIEDLKRRRKELEGRMEGRGEKSDKIIGVGGMKGMDRIERIDREIESVGGKKLNDLGKLNKIEKGWKERKDVIGRSSRRWDDSIVIEWKRKDEIWSRIGKKVLKRIDLRKKKIEKEFEIGGWIGGRIREIEWKKKVKVEEDMGRRSKRIGGMVGKGWIVMLGNKKNRNCLCN